MKRKIARNTIANAALRLSRYIIGFLLLPFIVSHIGLVDYGIYLLVGAFVGYFGLLDLGIGTALVKYVAEYKAKGEKETINDIVNSTFIFYFGIGLIICVSVLVIGTFYVDVFKIESGQIEKARMIAYLTAIGALTSWPLRGFGSSLHGLQRYDLDAIIRFIIRLVNAFVIVWLLLNGYGIIDMVFWGIVVGAIGQVAIVITVQKLLPFITLKRRNMKFSTFKKIFKFSSVVFIGQIVGLIIMGTDRIILGLFVSIGSITLYEVARRLYEVVQLSSSLPQSALLPAATELEALRKKEKLEQLIIRAGKYKCAIVLSVTTIIFVLAEYIILFWMGPEFTDMAPVTRVYISFIFFSAYGGVSGSVLYAKERYRPILYIHVSIAILNLILSLILVQYYGIMGVVMGTAIPYIIINPLYTPYVYKLLEVDLIKYLKSVMPQTYLPAGAMGLILFLIIFLFPPTNIIFVGILALLGLGIYFILFYEFSLNLQEKEELKNYIRRIFGK